MTGDNMYKPNEEFVAKAHIKSMDEYKKMYDESINDPDGFWGKIAEDFTWFKKWDKVRQFDFVEGYIKFFEGGKTNMSYNCLDRHLETRGDQTVFLWEGNEPGEDRKITYKELHEEVCKFANVLRKNGVKKGDRVCLYMQMIPELPVAMLACARIGAIHSVVFGAFSADSLKDRINDSTC
ncbi:MAG: AMP-binding protein, partial [Thermoplasmata archaeon]|nr:AMP-binding protein [Thermoplasmata archaeon]